MWMLEILIGLLKIIGIGLLVIFCILLLLILLVLFGAIRYQVEGSAKNRASAGLVLMETLKADIKVSWLNPLFRILVYVKGKKLSYQIKVFGFCVLDSEKPRPPKKPKKPKKEKQQSALGETEALEGTKEAVSMESSAEGDVTLSAQESSNPIETVGEKLTEVPQQETADTQTAEVQAAESQQTEANGGDTKPAKKVKKKKEKKKKLKDASAASGDDTKEKKKFDIAKIKETILKIKEKKTLVTEFIQNEANRHTIAGIFGTIKKVILHILPVKVQGTVVYGSGDPASTGKTFAILGILYAKYGESLTVLPDFEEKCLEADIKIKGRIRLGVMAWYVISFVLKKETRAFIKRCMQLIKQLKT